MTARTVGPVLSRVADLERIASEAYIGDRVNADARALVARYCAIVRAVLPRVAGWGAAQAGLMQATEQGIALLARFSRIPAASATTPVDGWLDQPTPTGLLTSGLAALVGYAESLDQAVTDADVARLRELQDAIGRAFGPGWRPAYGIGDPAREPDPEPDEAPPPPPWWVAIDPDAVAFAAVVAALLTVAILAVVIWGA